MDVSEVARDLVGLHATDPASAVIAAWARSRAPVDGELGRALYEERSLVRILGMRRTMFVLPVELAAIVQAACTQAIAVRERRRLVQVLNQAGIPADGDPVRTAGAWLEEVEQAALRALAARGEATTAELAGDEPRLREQIVLAEGRRYQARQSVAARVLFLLAAEGRVIRGRPRGSWTSGLNRWAPMDAWLPGGLAAWPADIARAELARRWLAAFGPGSAADLRWWTGWTVAEAGRALAQVRPAEVELDEGPGLVLAEDLERVAPSDPWAALLPGLDPTVMGWSSRTWFLGPHGPALFDRTGNAGPTVWWDGHVVGGWAQRKDGEIALRLLEDLGADGVAAVEAAADRLHGCLAQVRVVPRFRTPLERELSA